METIGGLWWLYVWIAWITFNMLMLLDFPDLHRAAFQPFHPAPGSGSRWADRGTAAAVRIPFEWSVCYGRFQAIEPWQRLLHRFRGG